MRGEELERLINHAKSLGKPSVVVVLSDDDFDALSKDFGDLVHGVPGIPQDKVHTLLFRGNLVVRRSALSTEG